jgi:hypothetical protein
MLKKRDRRKNSVSRSKRGYLKSNKNKGGITDGDYVKVQI